MTDQYAVFGNPIAHSKSPQIHAAFAQQTGQKLQYGAQCVALDQFQQCAGDFFAEGGKGLNITVPFKLDAYRFAAQLSEHARRAGAVNTLALQQDGSILGDNTDGVGLVRDIKNQGWHISGQRVLMLGAGGAARGVMEPLLQEQPAELVITNRTTEKAIELAEQFADLGNTRGCGFDSLPGHQFDVVINATSASLSGDLPPLPDDLLTESACCYDMMYGAEPTVFIEWARQHGAIGTADGLGMLVEQAAESFYLWRGVRPDTDAVIGGIRRSLSCC